MSPSVKNFNYIISKIKKSEIKRKVSIIAVSKTFKFNDIKPLLEYGHKDFGENKVQETEKKWPLIKESFPDIKLHMLGKLQRNKVNKAVNLFDYIHSLDNYKLADELSKSEFKNNKKLKYFVQVNIGNEVQKSGVAPKELNEFYSYCTKKLKLDILGLMAIPPNDNNADKYFKEIAALSNSLDLKEMSLGMSSDYLLAIKYGSTFVRIGTSIFGERSK